MKLQRIYSSKLYVTSTRKDKIHAAIQDPINAPLVQQLSDYLDEDSLVVLQQAESEIKSKEAQQDTGDGEVVAPPDSSFTPSGGSHSSFSGDALADFGGDDMGEGDLGESDIPDIDTEVTDIPEAPAESEDLAATTEISGTPITANCHIWTTLDDVVSDCEVIQGTLNAREDTKGVTRLQVKDHELWVYFNDEVNLNDKMIDVIEVLNSTGYTYLTFNRLARSNNAIVFDINLNTQNPIKSEAEVADEK